MFGSRSRLKTCTLLVWVFLSPACWILYGYYREKLLVNHMLVTCFHFIYFLRGSFKDQQALTSSPPPPQNQATLWTFEPVKISFSYSCPLPPSPVPKLRSNAPPAIWTILCVIKDYWGRFSKWQQVTTIIFIVFDNHVTPMYDTSTLITDNYDPLVIFT